MSEMTRKVQVMGLRPVKESSSQSYVDVTSYGCQFNFPMDSAQAKKLPRDHEITCVFSVEPYPISEFNRVRTYFKVTGLIKVLS